MGEGYVGTAVFRPLRAHRALNGAGAGARDPASSVDYGIWTQAIGIHFFRPGLNRAPTYLAFDEAAATQIGRGFGEGAENFVSVTAAVIDVDSDDPFYDAALHETGDEFPFLGILAAQVYVATGMGSFADLDPSAYWSPFYARFTKGRAFQPKALERLDQLWPAARAFYEARSRGRLAIQSDPVNTPHRGWRHINLPLWQALLRESDRSQIRHWLRDHPSAGPDVAKLLGHLAGDAEHFNRKLAQTLRDASRSDSLAAALETLLDELVSSAASDISPRIRRSPGRLRLVGRDALSCFLQRHGMSGEWDDAVGPLETRDLREGAMEHNSGAAWPGDERILFLDAGPFVGYVSHRGVVAPNTAVALLYSAEDESVESHLVSLGRQVLALDERLRGFRAVHLASAADAELLSFFSCSLAGDQAISLEGGLRYRGRYLGTNPPRIHLNPASTVVKINGVVQKVDSDGYVAMTTPMAPGRYEVTAAAETLHFHIDDGTTLHDSSEGEEICIALSRSGIMRTARIDSLPTQHYLVGAYLGSAPA